MDKYWLICFIYHWMMYGYMLQQFTLSLVNNMFIALTTILN